MLAYIGAGAFVVGTLGWLAILLFTRYRRATRIAATVAGWTGVIGFACIIVAKVHAR